MEEEQIDNSPAQNSLCEQLLTALSFSGNAAEVGLAVIIAAVAPNLPEFQEEMPLATVGDLTRRLSRLQMLIELPLLKRLTQRKVLQALESSAIALAPVFKNLEMVARRNPAAVLGRYLEYSTSSVEAQHRGSYFTPAPIARRLVELALDSCQTSDETLLDPACGGGVFLLEAINTLKQRGVDTPQAMANKIFGADILPLAAETTQLALLFALRSSFYEQEFSYHEITTQLQRNIVSTDMLNGTSKTPFSEAQFSIIIGNPPFGLAWEGRIDEQKKEELNARFADFTRGKANSYLYFLARSLQMVKSNGQIILLVPDTFLTIDNARHLRQQLLDKGQLKRVVSFSRTTLFNAQVEVVAVQIDLAGKKEEIELQQIEDDRPSNSLVSVATCRYILNNQIPQSWSKTQQELADEIACCEFKVGDERSPFMPAIAIQAYRVGLGTPPQSAADVANHIFHTRVATKTTVPYLEGKDVQRYQINWSGSFLRCGPWLAAGQPLERFSGPRIILREVLGKDPYLIVAAYCEKPFIYNRSCLHILPRFLGREEKPQQLVWALLAVLNSRKASQILKLIGKKVDRSIFPKLLLSDLKQFPLPNNFLQFAPQLAELARLGANAQSELDHLVEEAYKKASLEGSLQRDHDAEQNNCSTNQPLNDLLFAEEELTAKN